MSETRIEWADATWNPITGCSPISEGCANCYAERMSKRLAGRAGYPADNPFGVVLHSEKKLLEPLRWRKPRKIFVCSMGDLFHEDVPEEWIDQVFAVMALAPQHTFMVLTKRPERMQAYLSEAERSMHHEYGLPDDIAEPVIGGFSSLLEQSQLWRSSGWRYIEAQTDHYGRVELAPYWEWHGESKPFSWPLPNVWLGVSAENQ